MNGPPDSFEILRAIRRIVRAVDLQSRDLRREAGVGVPELLTLEAIGHAAPTLAGPGAPPADAPPADAPPADAPPADAPAADAPRVLATDLARTVGVSLGTMSGIVDRLVRQGLVARHRDAADRRQVRLDLTDAGRDRLARTPAALQTRLVERLHALPAADRARILAVLEQLIGLMDARQLDAAPILTTDAALHPDPDDPPG